jgi:hypothetical protein
MPGFLDLNDRSHTAVPVLSEGAARLFTRCAQTTHPSGPGPMKIVAPATDTTFYLGRSRLDRSSPVAFVHSQAPPHADTPTRRHAHTPTRPHAHTPTRPHAHTPLSCAYWYFCAMA